MLATAGRMPALPNIVERELPEHHSSRQAKGSASMLLARLSRSLISGLKSKTARALPPARGLVGRFARLWDTRVFARLTIAGHRCSFGFQ
jgi:hypothetical protein